MRLSETDSQPRKGADGRTINTASIGKLPPTKPLKPELLEVTA